MAQTASPYGLVPVNLIGGRVYSGSTRMLPIASGSATSIFYGDVVKPLSTGFIDKDVGTTTLTPIGVFLGVSYVDPSYGLTFRQMWTGATVTYQTQPAMAVVCDDPFAVFRIQASAAMLQTTLFNNAGVIQGSGNTTSGNSGVSMDATTTTSNTLPLRVIGWAGNNVNPGLGAGTAQECVAPTDLFPDVLVMWNATMQTYMQSLGI